MPNGSTLMLFVGAAIALLLTPGPAVLYIITRSVDQGRAAGLVSVLGICTGTMVHIVAATIGLSALLVSSPVAFAAVRYAGAVYLIVMGIQTLMRRDDPSSDATVARGSLRRVYTQGVIVNVLNPHTALFVFAFLPQFVNQSAGHAPLQMLVLGMLFVALSVTTDSGWALAAGTAGQWIREHPDYARRQRHIAGGALIGLGALTALTGRAHK